MIVECTLLDKVVLFLKSNCYIEVLLPCALQED